MKSTLRDFVGVLLLLVSCILTTTNALSSSTNYRTRPFATAFRCPLCHLAKSNDNSTNSNAHSDVTENRLWTSAYSASSSPLTCSQGHSFDRSAQGYVNLLSGGVGGRSKITGDTTAMCQARRNFLNQGHYQDLAEMVCSEVTGTIMKMRDADEERRQQEEKEAAAAAAALTAEEESNQPTQDDTPSSPSSSSLTPRQRKMEAKRRQRRVDKESQRAQEAVTAEAKEHTDAFQRLPLVVDLGCGEGWYTGHLADALLAESSSENTVGVARIAALDVSKDAASMTARRFPAVVPPQKTTDDAPNASAAAITPTIHVDVAVANAKAILPFADDSVSVVVSIFAPRDTSEIYRVMKKKRDGAGSVIVIAQPNPRHLQELRTFEVGGRGLNFVSVEEDKERRVVDGMVSAGFTLSHQQTLEGSMTLSATDLGNLVRMGPSAFHQTESSEQVLAELDQLEHFEMSVTKSFLVLVFEPVSDGVKL
jgi:23S rRNA (guanine745-N1)-methyltransferase